MSEYPAAESLPVRQRSTVSTYRPARYLKQLGSHMGRKISTEEIPGGLRLIFNRDGIFRGYGDLVADDANHALIMEVRAEDDEKAQNLAGVLERHLVRFGEREELVVEFHAVYPLYSVREQVGFRRQGRIFLPSRAKNHLLAASRGVFTGVGLKV